jgi:5-(hydroxymethyl)furfural/furfural oxidase
MPLFYGDRYIWPGLTASAGRAESGAALSRAYEQGRVMGGGSGINVQSANRGLPRDYDEWRDLGAKGCPFGNREGFTPLELTSMHVA